MKRFSINMKFWHDGQQDSTRIRNVRYCWPKMKSMVEYFKNNTDYTYDCRLFDFSPTQVIDDAEFIPYPIGTYKKAEKTNIILNQYAGDSNYFMMIDCDAFFIDEDFDKLIEIFHKINSGDIFTFDLAKISNIEECYVDGIFDKNKCDWSYAYSGHKSKGPLNGYRGGLGGVYLIDSNLLRHVNGFDEQYVGWGGEDGECLKRICESNIFSIIKPQNTFAPFHMPHFCDFENSLYGKRFEES